MKALLIVFLSASFQLKSLAQPDYSFFENKIRPVLHARCTKCHGERKNRGKLRLHTPAAIRKGGESGSIIAEGKPNESLLIHAIRYVDPDLKMPPIKKLDDQVIKNFVQWVKDGAPMPGGSEFEKSASLSAIFSIEERKKHWAWQPLLDPTPTIGNSWSSHPIDVFIWNSLAAKNMSPAPRASKRILLRRLFFDLIGLPPTPSEVDSFLNDSTPNSWENQVDRLLASPHFGEKWARHWLDLVGYTETQGFEYDFSLPNAWQYRDYLIRAFNNDVPYNRLVAEHIAGDLINEPRRNKIEGFDESPLGTAFWLFGQEPHSPVSPRVDQLDRAARKIDVMSKAFLGVTVACARCHDHKFDAISTEDYYALSGFILSSSYRQLRFESEEMNQTVARQLRELRREQGQKILKATGKSLLLRLQKLDRSIGQALSEAGTNGDPMVQAWRKHLDASAKNPNDPFFGSKTIKESLGSKAPVAFHWAQPMIPEDAKIVQDYTSTTQQTHWFTNGPGFGLAPSQIGDVRISDDPSRPLARVVTKSAASWDKTWNILRPESGVETSPTALNWPQVGRTLKSRSITLTNGKLHYLVRGEGVAFVEINAHRVIHGPLHQKSIRRFATKDGALQWITHDLSAYVGRRVHVEFSSVGEKTLDVMMVVESKTDPTLDLKPGPLLTALRGSAKKPRSLAVYYAKALSQAARLATRGKLNNNADGHEAAWLINWMVEHPELLRKQSNTPKSSLGRQFQGTVAKKRDLLASIKRLSQQAPTLTDGSGDDERILLRGSHLSPGKKAARRFLSAIDGSQPLAINSGSGRLELADRLTDPQNPLFARVMVNRLWHHTFGRGLVKTTDDFGVKGQQPSHPLLLDWLARNFINNNWSIKAMIRQFVLSQAYQMASHHEDSRMVQIDPENKLLHRMPRRRLRAEAIRDSILATSGRLDRKVYGRPIAIHLTPFMQGRGRPKSGPLDGHGRRSLYLSVRLNFLSPFFLAFDFPRPTTCIGRRTNSNVPAQSLAMMNDPFVIEQATIWAKRILSIKDLDDEGRIRRVYLEAYARPAAGVEITKAREFLADAVEHHDGQAEAAWADFCHALFNTKEFWHTL